MTNIDEQIEAAGEAVAAGAAMAGHAPPAAAGGWTRASVYGLSVLTLISTLNYFDRSVIALVLPLIKTEFHASDTTLGLVSSLILIYAVLGVPVASLADRWSRKYVIAAGLAVWSVMTVVTGFSASILQLGIFRFLMGAGEACGLAPSQSMIADMFDRARRPLALAILTTASSIAAIVYSPIVGITAGHYGWRAAFFLAGAPGLLVLALFLLTVKEPARGAAEPRAEAAAAGERASLGEALRFCLGSRTYWLIVLGAGVMGIYIYGVGAWGVTYLVRVRHLTIPEIGAYVTPVRGAVGAAGILLGGWLVGRLGRIDERWRCWVPGIACLLLAPCEFAFVFGGPTWLWVSAMLGSSLLAIMHQPGIYAVLNTVAKPRMRAVGISLALLAATVMGQFGGPVLIGRLNDVLHARYGDMAIRYSMLVVMACAALGGLLFLLASRSVVADTERAERS